jgi:TetR/AcrR family transcriptional repressor for divergent bdcA
MRAFWQHSYEGTSIETLRAAMGGISSASFYAAYGSKEQLYREALDRYLATHGRVVAPLFDTTVAPRKRIEQTLRGSARMQSDAQHPLGCMVTLSATIGSVQNENLRQTTAAIRRENKAAIDRAVAEAVGADELRPDAAVGLPVLLDMALNGLTLLARDGSDRELLYGAVDAAMAAWDSYKRA